MLLKKGFSGFIAFVLCLSLLPISVLADGEAVAAGVQEAAFMVEEPVTGDGETAVWDEPSVAGSDLEGRATDEELVTVEEPLTDEESIVWEESSQDGSAQDDSVSEDLSQDVEKVTDADSFAWEESPAEGNGIPEVNVITEGNAISEGYAIAEDPALAGEYSGECGDSLFWTLSADGVLTITGEGEMWDSPSWENYKGRITSVIFPENLTTIGSGAFENCAKLTKVTIPDSVFTIWTNAFRNSKIQTVSLPEGVTIERWAFAGCQSLTGVDIPDDATINEGAFENCGALTDVTIGKNITKIGYGAFKNCGKLQSIKIPGDVNEIGITAFQGCGNLQKVEIEDGVTLIEDSAFRECRKLKELTIPASVAAIENNAFTDCAQLTSFVFPDGMSSISRELFTGCKALKSVTIPSSVSYVGYSAFGGCSALTDVHYGDSWEEWLKIEFDLFNDYLTDLPISCTDGTFVKGTCGDDVKWTLHLEEHKLTISGTGSMWDQGSGGFRWYDRRNDITSVVIEDGVTTIGDGAFSGCTRLAKVTIPDCMEGIGSEAFAECSSLSSVRLPGKVTRIGDRAFSECSSLVDVELSNSLTRIPESAFSGCSSLTSMTFPDTLTEIERYAFQNCSSLKSITVPVRMEYIGEYVFSGCRRLTDVNYKGSIRQWQEIDIRETGNESLYSASLHCSVKVSVKGARVKVADQTYTGKALTPKVTVTLDGRTLKKGTDYTVTYSNNTLPGTATVTVKGTGNYNGTATKKFKISLKKPAITSLKNTAAKKVTVKWSKVAGVTGYKIQYATNSSFSGAKTVTVKGASSVSKVLSGFTKGKTYYFRMQTYVSSGGKTYSSAWSATGKVKITK